MKSFPQRWKVQANCVIKWAWVQAKVATYWPVNKVNMWEYLVLYFTIFTCFYVFGFGICINKDKEATCRCQHRKKFYRIGPPIHLESLHVEYCLTKVFFITGKNSSFLVQTTLGLMQIFDSWSIFQGGAFNNPFLGCIRKYSADWECYTPTCVAFKIWLKYRVLWVINVTSFSSISYWGDQNHRTVFENSVLRPMFHR